MEVINHKNLIFATKQRIMNTAELKSDLYKLIERTEDTGILKALKTILKKQIIVNKKDIDFWNELPADLKFEIEEGLNEIENGEEISHEEVMKKYQKWV